MVRKLRLTFFSSLLGVVFFFIVGWLGLFWYGNKQVTVLHDTEFVVVVGDSLGSVVQRLAVDNLILYPEIFKVFAIVKGVSTNLYAGEYLISPGITYLQLLNKFVERDVCYYKTTLVEGWTIKEWLDSLNNDPKLSDHVSTQELKNLGEVVGKAVDGWLPTDNLEGLFYADTYSFESGDSVRSILIRANKKLQSVLTEEWEKRSKHLPYKSPYEALIMASIVEKETGVPSERADIAGVFVRRLQKKMRLQADPTVIYGLGERYEGDIKRGMLTEHTPYNTYVIHGLTPTPIAAVGREAIHAALNPSDGKSLYFVARGDGTHYFSKTLDEHNRAVRKYQITKRRQDYRSTVK